MHEVVEMVRNDGAVDCDVVMEPWGMPLRLAAGRAFRIVARSPAPGKLEVVRRFEAVIVYAWPGRLPRSSTASASSTTFPLQFHRCRPACP